MTASNDPEHYGDRPASAGLANPFFAQGEKELVQIVDVLRGTIEAASDAILVTDARGVVRTFNEGFLIFWRLARERVANRSVTEVWKEIATNFADPSAFTDLAAQIGAGDEEIADELDLNDGRIFERHTKVLTVNDETAGRVWSFRDLSERYSAHITSRRLAAIVASSDDAIISKDLHSIITSWNQGAERIFGYAAAEMIGESMMRLIPPERQAEEETILSRIRNGERFGHFETVRVRKDGTYVDVSITVSPIKNASGQVVGASNIARDITREKEAAMAVRNAMEQMQRANADRQSLLESEREARAEAERAGRMKDEFLATLSHELRTPLNAIVGWVNLLQMGSENPDDLRQGLETIGRNARAQAQIIEDLLDMSRIISGKIRLDVQPVDLVSVLSAAVDTMRAAADAKGVRIQPMLDPQAGTVSGDSNRLLQVFWNLLNNAIKFTPRNGRVQVVLKRVNSNAEVTITDTGEGIAPEFLPFVFDRFKQADASITRRHGGLGLGLAIVKQLVELHGGRVSAQSGGVGQGSIFTVDLPLPSVYHETRGNRVDRLRADRGVALVPEVSLQGIEVLVADDDADAREVVRRLLLATGASVRAVGSACEAYDEVALHPPDVLVCDIGMPGEDGYSLIRRLREREGGGPQMPAIALTAYARTEDRTKAIRLGFQNHLSKPVDPAELLAVVGSLAARRR